MTVSWSPAGRVLELQRRSVEVLTDQEYHEIGVRSFGKGLFQKEPTSGASLGDKRVFCVRTGDLVISNVFAWEGAVAVAGPEHDGMIGSHRFMTWTSRGDVDVSYLRHYFLSDPGLGNLRRASPGSAGRNRTLSIAAFEAIKVPLPSLTEQRRIADHLTDLGAMSDVARTATDRLKATSHSIFDRLVLVPDHSKYPLGDVVQLARESVDVVPDRSYKTLGLKNRGRGLFERAEFTGGETKYPRLFAVRSGQLVYSKLFGWEGSVAIVPDRFDGRFVSPEFPTFDVDAEHILPDYLEHLAQHQAFTSQLASSTTGMGQRRQRVNIDDFLNIDVPVPSVLEQQSIVRQLDQVRHLDLLMRNRARLADALLPAARNEIFNAMR